MKRKPKRGKAKWGILKWFFIIFIGVPFLIAVSPFLLAAAVVVWALWAVISKVKATQNAQKEAAPVAPQLTPSEPALIATASPIRSKADLAKIKSYVVLDTETTGLSREHDKIIDIGMIRFENGKEVARYSTLVNPKIPIPPMASRVNRLTDADVENAPIFEDIAKDVAGFIDGCFVVGHNVQFDLAFLKNAIPTSYPKISVKYIDTVALSKRAFPGLPNHKLATLVKELGICDQQSHRALDDAAVTAQIFEKCCDALKAQG